MRRIFCVCGLAAWFGLLFGCSQRASEPTSPTASTEASATTPAIDPSDSPPHPAATASFTASNNAPTETPQAPPPDPDEIRAQELVTQFLAADEVAKKTLGDQLQRLGDKAIAPLLAVLIEADQLRPEILKLLHEQTGYQGPLPLVPFAVAVLPDEQRVDGPYRDVVVPRYRLVTVLAETDHPEPAVRRGALRYLRQLGDVGEDRLALASVVWSILPFDPDPQVRAEAQHLRREQTDLALAMLEKDLSAFQPPHLSRTAVWLAQLGSEAVRRGLELPKISLRTTHGLQAMEEMFRQSMREARIKRRREHFEQVKAGLIHEAKMREMERHPWRPRYMRRQVEGSMNLRTFDFMAELSSQRQTEEEDIRDAQVAAAQGREYANDIARARIAIETLQTARDALLIQVLALEDKIDFQELYELSAFKNSVHDHVLGEAQKRQEEGQHALAWFWATEASACYREWTSGPHVNYFSSVLWAVLAAEQLGQLDDGLAMLDEAERMLVTVGDYRSVVASRPVDGRSVKVRLLACRESIYDRRGWPELVTFVRHERERFGEPMPEDSQIEEALQIWRDSGAPYWQGEYPQAIDMMFKARRVLDPPNRDTGGELLTLTLRLSNSLREVGRVREAIYLAQQGIVLATHWHGEQSYYCAPAYLQLGAAQRDAGMLEQAELNLGLGRSLHVEGAILGRRVESKHLANCSHHLGLLRIKQGRLDEGKSLLQEALVGRGSEYGKDHPFTRQTQQALAELSPE